MRDISLPPGTPKSRRRELLRAFNGALLAAPLGGLLGAALGVLFALSVSQAWRMESGIAQAAFYGSIAGAPPGLLAGALMGTTMAMRDPARRLKAGVSVGTIIGFLYSLPFCHFRLDPIVPVSIILSGILGGVILSLLLRWIRSRWSWWSRWEEPQ